MIHTDICVIGAGAAGLSVAAGAVQMGARVVLIEAGEMGGDCLNSGCVPSKALLAAAHKAHQTAQSAFGVAGHDPAPDFAAAKDHLRSVIARIAPVDSQARFEGLGVRVIRARARFRSPTTLTAGDHVITARRFVIATGSRPSVPSVPGLGDVPYLTNETLFDLSARPDHLIIIGGGPIGIEMAQAHRRLGSAVTVVEAARALGRDDPEAVALVLARLRAEGVTIHEGAAVTAVSGQAGAVRVDTAQGQSVTGTHLLIAIGRQPVVDGLGLDLAGVDHGPGGIAVDAGLRSSNRRIFAIGDVTGCAQFTHVAGYQAGVIVLSMLCNGAGGPWLNFGAPILSELWFPYRA